MQNKLKRDFTSWGSRVFKGGGVSPLPLRVMEKLGFPEGEIYLLKSSGSGCKFYRIKDKDAIIVVIDGKHKEFNSYIEISKSLLKIGVAVPEIYYYNIEEKLIVEEDLGDLTLQSYIIKTDDFNIYKQVIDVLILMQIRGKGLNNKVFGLPALCWDAWYFGRYFLEAFCGISNLSLQSEFHKLADKLAREPLYFMHRDFQAQNIMLKEGKVRIIDFQNAQQGLLAYDLVSLLKDAYLPISDDIREEMIDYYLYQLKEHITLDKSHFRNVFLYAGLQRNMQALGAFAYLSMIENKVQFAEYIPRVVHYLLDALKKVPEFPELLKIVAEVNAILG
ncbi:MAG: phosphotransferase [Candidatus Stahlbacteria bacterium]|nr:phosphotransferase [Candidatus Stahlbacteria bacterium]